MNGQRADSFLHMIRRSQRGKLKIYLGYAPGVGKTYQMLLEAHRLKDDGIDVAAALVETHGRIETETLLMGLEVIPRRKIGYRGIQIEEMDLEKVLARCPSVALVDELAHTNIPGSKNAKRYQDVEEILAAGIHVMSTLNVQHLESLYETVEQATGVKVRERIPDRVVTEADQIVDVDITTEDLRRRLTEGKVYTTERIETALENFFLQENLEQLRELTLRELASQIDSRRRDQLLEDTPSSPDQVMACLSSRGPNTEALLRYASRLAGRLNRNWYAVYVQTSKERPTVIDAATQRKLSDTLTLAQQLGATVFTFRGDDIVKTLLEFAKEYRVGHLVIGTPAKRLPFWRRLLGQLGILERLVLERTGTTIVILDTRAITASHSHRALTVVPGQGRSEEGPLTGKHRPQATIDIRKERVLIWNQSMVKQEAMKMLLDSFRLPATVRESAWQALVSREKQGGTFLGEEVTIPHARIAEIEQPLVALGICRKGIVDDLEAHTFQIMVLFLSPTNQPESHLFVLQAIGRMAQDDILRRRLLAAEDPAEVAGIVGES
ncbi:MAG: two-component system, OmpR family, sensor histidine kinase KdpD [Thermodesulfobacteriota bacterium]|nr:two-component system, OmpR family, sensor histidine kinase KdpD [Thermodesulfobacteriota bacterium]